MSTLLAETQALIPDWNARKAEQMLRKGGNRKEVRFASYGPGKSTHMMIWSTPGFYEGVLIAQLPRVEVRPRKPRPSSPQDFKVVPEHQKKVANRLVDLTDEDIDQVFELWERGKSAIGLEFVPAVWTRSGKVIEA